MENKIIINGIFYIILTSFFIYIFIKEKKLSKKFRILTDKFSEKMMTILRIKQGEKNIKKIISLISSIITALILVIIIQRFYIGNFVIPTGSMIPTIEVKDRLFADMISYKFREPKRNEIIVFKEPMQNKLLYTKRAMGLPGEKISIKDNNLYIDEKVILDRKYSNLGIEDKEWIIPKKGDTLTILPAGNYRKFFKDYNININEVQKNLAEYPSEIEKILPNLKFLVNGFETGMILDFIHDDSIMNKILDGKKVEIILKDDYILALGDNTNHSFDSRFWGFVASKRIRGRGIFRFWPLNRIGFLK